MQEQRSDVPQPQTERAPWVEPILSRLEAGAAELLVGPTSDGPDDS